MGRPRASRYDRPPRPEKRLEPAQPRHPGCPADLQVEPPRGAQAPWSPPSSSSERSRARTAGRPPPGTFGGRSSTVSNPRHRHSGCSPPAPGPSGPADRRGNAGCSSGCPRRGWRTGSPHGAVVRIVESGESQQIVLDEVRPLEPVGRLVEPFTPLRQPGGRGSATKRRGPVASGAEDGVSGLNSHSRCGSSTRGPLGALRDPAGAPSLFGFGGTARSVLPDAFLRGCDESCSRNPPPWLVC